MFEGLTQEQLPGALEALLFVSNEPVDALELAQMLEVETSAVTSALVQLQARFEEENRGIQLREVAGGWRLYTHPLYHDLIEKYVISWDTRKLSQAALETLAIIAYCQPVTRAGVASIRGVNSDSSINSLLEKGLIREAGTADAPGNPMRYATSRSFLERFGLRTVADLPDVSQFAPDEETRALICERLGVTSEEAYNAEAEADKQKEPPDVMQLSFIDEEDGELGGLQAGGFSSLAESLRENESLDTKDLLNAALATGFGLTEKVDLSKLHFEDEDE